VVEKVLSDEGGCVGGSVDIEMYSRKKGCTMYEIRKGDILLG
jgi:hypothetical protein